MEVKKIMNDYFWNQEIMNTTDIKINRRASVFRHGSTPYYTGINSS